MTTGDLASQSIQCSQGMKLREAPEYTVSFTQSFSIILDQKPLPG